MADIVGTSNGESLAGTEDADAIDGLGGSDHLYGGLGADEVVGGDGDDFVFDNTNASSDLDQDSLFGGEGTDRLYGGFNDVFDGGGGAFDSLSISGGLPSDAVDIDFSSQTGDAFVLVEGGSFTNVELVSLELTDHDDRVVLGRLRADVAGGAGDDTIVGSSGGETIRGGSGADELRGGAGADSIDATFSTYEYDPGDAGYGGRGDDSMTGGVGDTLRGGRGQDTFSLYLDEARRAIVVEQRADGQVRASVDDALTLAIGFEAGSMSLGRGDDHVGLARGALTIDGGAGDDTVLGGAGDDTMVFSVGQDVFEGGEGSDTFSFGHKYLSGGLEIDLSLSGPQQLTEQGSVTLVGIENLEGAYNENPERFIGDGADNVLRGKGGDDTLIGGEGDDLLEGDGPQIWSENRDSLVGGAGADTLQGGRGGDVLDGGVGADVYRYTAWNESYSFGGSRQYDRIVSLEAEDVIDLSLIDPIEATSTDDAFALVSGPSDTPGSIYWTYNARKDVSTLWLVTDSLALSDPKIEVAGDHRDFDNFVL